MEKLKTMGLNPNASDFTPNGVTEEKSSKNDQPKEAHKQEHEKSKKKNRKKSEKSPENGEQKKTIDESHKENDEQKELIAQLQKENAEQKKTIRLLQKENTEQKKIIVREKQFIEVLQHRPLQADYINNVREKAIEQVERVEYHKMKLLDVSLRKILQVKKYIVVNLESLTKFKSLEKIWEDIKSTITFEDSEKYIQSRNLNDYLFHNIESFLELRYLISMLLETKELQGLESVLYVMNLDDDKIREAFSFLINLAREYMLIKMYKHIDKKSPEFDKIINDQGIDRNKSNIREFMNISSIIELFDSLVENKDDLVCRVIRQYPVFRAFVLD